MAALEERGGSKISIPNILTIFMYAPETETAEGVGEYELDLRPRWKMDILASNFQRFLAGVLRCELAALEEEKGGKFRVSEKGK